MNFRLITIFYFLLFVSLPTNANSSDKDIKTYVPENSKKLLPVLKDQQETYWTSHPKPNYFAGLIEQESCISLTHSKCWNPSVKLDTSREFGAGLGQLTKAYDKNGKIRFDSLSDLTSRHVELKDLKWDNILNRPDLQLRAIVIKSKDDFNTLSSIKDPNERLKFVDVSYNQGIGRTMIDRRTCGLMPNCNPNLWDNNVELIGKGKGNPLYGNRTAYMISREHVSNIFNLRMNKYEPYFKN